MPPVGCDLIGLCGVVCQVRPRLQTVTTIRHGHGESVMMRTSPLSAWQLIPILSRGLPFPGHPHPGDSIHSRRRSLAVMSLMGSDVSSTTNMSPMPFLWLVARRPGIRQTMRMQSMHGSVLTSQARPTDELGFIAEKLVGRTDNEILLATDSVTDQQ